MLNIGSIDKRIAVDTDCLARKLSGVNASIGCDALGESAEKALELVEIVREKAPFLHSIKGSALIGVQELPGLSYVTESRKGKRAGTEPRRPD